MTWKFGLLSFLLVYFSLILLQSRVCWAQSVGILVFMIVSLLKQKQYCSAQIIYIIVKSYLCRQHNDHIQPPSFAEDHHQHGHCHHLHCQSNHLLHLQHYHCHLTQVPQAVGDDCSLGWEWKLLSSMLLLEPPLGPEIWFFVFLQVITIYWLWKKRKLFFGVIKY